ncbi:MAG: multidrug effflux MFS transporter [Rhizobiaceae bacterium]|nr:multidrug effflux MFS transporter [Rhizobiaceae bacterium]
MDIQQPQRPLMSERRVGIIGACLAMIGPFSMSVYTPAMPEIVHAFGTTEEAVKMSLSLYFAGFAFAQLVTGPLSDGLGRRPVTIAFMAIYTMASLAALFAPGIGVLIAARFVQGIGAAAGIAMSRAIVRDLFNHDQAARIMNLIATILAIGPALAPTIGGLTMKFFGWHAIFFVMAVAGGALVLMTIFGIRETVERDLGRISPRALLASYASLLKSPYFMTASLTNAGATGAIYALATMLPFVMMNRVGLTPTQFGLAMLMQSGSFIVGSLTLRWLMRRWSPAALVPLGLTLVGLASIAFVTLPRIWPPSFATVMVPLAFYAFGVAFIVSVMTMAAMAPFGRNAGAASALLGFMQMGTGLAGGSLAALIGDAVVALATVVPLLGFIAIVSWLVWRRLPMPS